jgi:hypothetical protein
VPAPGGLLERIGRAAGVGDLVAVLAERLAPTDLGSLLLEVARRRAAALTPAQVLQRHERDPAVRPSPVDPRAARAFEDLAFAVAAPPFEPVALAPVAPLGTTSVLSGLSQDLAVATSRGTEVLSDATNVLALECAARRRAAGGRRARVPAVRLCAAHRMLRPQPLSDPRLLPHFGLVALATAARGSRSWRAEAAAVREHVEVHVRLLHRAGEVGLVARRPRVALTPLEGGPAPDLVDAALVAPLRDALPAADVVVDPARTSGRGYYAELCFAVSVEGAGGERHVLVDGGLVEWTQRLLADRKERLVISGVGSDLATTVLAAPDLAPSAS